RLKRLKRLNRSFRLKPRSPKRWKPEGEFIIGPRCIGIRPIEWDIGAPRIPIPRIEPPCPLICAVAVEAAKTHAATQPRRMIFFEVITLFLLKNSTRRDLKVSPLTHLKGNAVVTIPMRRQREIAFI